MTGLELNSWSSIAQTAGYTVASHLHAQTFSWTGLIAEQLANIAQNARSPAICVDTDLTQQLVSIAQPVRCPVSCHVYAQVTGEDCNNAERSAGQVHSDSCNCLWQWQTAADDSLLNRAAPHILQLPMKLAADRTACFMACHRAVNLCALCTSQN